MTSISSVDILGLAHFLVRLVGANELWQPDLPRKQPAEALAQEVGLGWLMKSPLPVSWVGLGQGIFFWGQEIVFILILRQNLGELSVQGF